MGDMGEIFNAMKAEKKERHARWHKENRALIEASGIPYDDRGEALLFRFSTVRADFYPSTRRWREITGQGYKTRGGGGQAFLNWLEKRLPVRRP